MATLATACVPTVSHEDRLSALQPQRLSSLFIDFASALLSATRCRYICIWIHAERAAVIVIIQTKYAAPMTDTVTILSLIGLIYATAAFRTLCFIAFLCPVFLPRNPVPYFPHQQLCSPFSSRAFSIPAILCRIVLCCIISATYGVPIYNPIMTKTAPFTEVHYHVCLFPVSCTTE